MLERDSPYWVYQYKRPDQPGKWTKILSPLNTDKSIPLPRYAHQVVFDNRTKSIFMHGGNAGLKDETPVISSGEGSEVDDARHRASTRDVGVGTDSGRQDIPQVGASDGEENRLDDFWTMRLKRLVLDPLRYCL